MSEVAEAVDAYWKSRRRKLGSDSIGEDQPSNASPVLEDRVILQGRGYLGTYHLKSKRITFSQRDADLWKRGL